MNKVLNGGNIFEIIKLQHKVKKYLADLAGSIPDANNFIIPYEEDEWLDFENKKRFLNLGEYYHKHLVSSIQVVKSQDDVEDLRGHIQDIAKGKKLCMLRHAYTDPDVQKRHLMTDLSLDALDKIKKEKFDLATAIAHPENKAAHKWMNKIGFEHIGEYPRLFEDGKLVTGIVFGREL